MIVVLYLIAIVLANLTIAHFGPSAAIIVAFLFIGLDLTARDRLHDAWKGRYLWPKMALLIAAGSLLSWFLNREAGRIAVASFVAFAAAGTADAILYHLLRRQNKFVQVNGSNLLAAAVDSIVFPTLAFGGLLPAIVLGQFGAKVLGGLVASWFIYRRKEATDQAELPTPNA